MNSKVRALSAVFSLGCILFGFNHCVMESKTNSKPSTITNSNDSQSNTTNNNNNSGNNNNNSGNNNNNSGNNNNNGGNTPVDPGVVQAEEVDIGIKNFEQIKESMAVLTGVSSTSNAIRNTYRDLEVQLPTENSIKSFLGANQVAITKLAAEYCDQLVNSGNLRGQVWNNFNFNGTPNQVLSNNTQKNQVINQTLDKFWGTSMNNTMRTQSQGEMLSLLNDLLSGENLGSNNTTRTVVKGVCTAALASAQVTLL